MISPDQIEELKIELTDACQLACGFCHRGTRRQQAHDQALDFLAACNWIDWAGRQGIPSVRFTGGEPTLHPKLLDLCRHARERGLRVVVNSNGQIEPCLLLKLVSFVDVLKLSLPLPSESECDDLTRRNGSFLRKIETAAVALERCVEVELLTVLGEHCIGRVREILHLVESYPGMRWVPLRIESSPDSARPLTRCSLQLLVEELDQASQQVPGCSLKLNLAVPFCAVRPPELAARILSGRAQDCGPFRSLVVSVRGELMSCYSCREPIRQRSTLRDALEDPVVRSLTDPAFLPERCQRCAHLPRCAGGCRSPHGLVPCQSSSIDYLASEEASS
jgi:radical SAM protein with 4Fe4S-binding SPASM domain